MTNERACANNASQPDFRAMRDRILTVMALLDSVDMLADHIGIHTLSRNAQENLNQLVQELKEITE